MSVNDAYVNEASHEFASRGMRVEGTAHIDPGTVLHRFVLRADVADCIYVANPWWFQASAVRKILEAARQGHFGDSTASGQATKGAGLSKTWKNNADTMEEDKIDKTKESGSHYLLTVKTFASLTLFWGAPRAVGKADAKDKRAQGLQSGDDVAEIEVVPNPRCVQFFIPGMHEIASKAVSVVSKTKLKHSTELAGGDVELFLRKVSGRG